MRKEDTLTEDSEPQSRSVAQGALADRMFRVSEEAILGERFDAAHASAERLLMRLRNLPPGDATFCRIRLVEQAVRCLGDARIDRPQGLASK